MKLVYNDSTHSYVIDNKRRAKSVTAVAKIVPDNFALEQWSLRQVAIGMTLDQSLTERVAADIGNREMVNQVCQDAKAAAGANQAATRGSQRHRATELLDTGGNLLTDQQRKDAEVWRRTLDVHGMLIDPNRVEGFVMWPEHGVCGRYDRIAWYDGRPVMVDLKSGANAVRYPQSVSVQLALYAYAPMTSASIAVDGDRSTVTEWVGHDDSLDLDKGYVILLEDGKELGELYEINIRHGWAGAQQALDIVDWRKAHNYGSGLAKKIEPPKTPDGDQLIKAIESTQTEQGLLQLWRAAKDQGLWTDRATQAAKQRKTELTKVAKGN